MGFKNVRKCTVLIDFNNQVWRNYHATEKENLVNDDGINTGVIIGLVKVLNHSHARIKQDHSLPNLVICEDRYPTRKKELYKTHQDAFKDYAPKTIIYKDRPKKDLDYNPIDICRQFVDCIPHEKIYCEGEEADDVMAAYIANHPNDAIFLFSTDKDMWQLLAKFPNLTIILGDGKSPTKEKMHKEFNGAEESHILLHKIIRGDNGDTVKSIYRFPFKKNESSYLRCDGSVKDFLRCIKEDCGPESKEYLQLRSNLKLIKLNNAVVKLREDIPYTSEHIEKPNYTDWKKLCHGYQVPSLFDSHLLKLF